ncbi:GNAT family N-acetyltransferase [Streptomyces sp. NBC_00237]|uniref:GNAT family N-acetyltransferase n=1 Tax=Streptomyces sp. NBC_00237 TaxID=2975687 RepID=UPI002251491C|nr:GNAT family N-acetyltransferase [Streptomyces sp. NBC_00237]MCX5205254.1 GNAT family N-acetyltransferase [Streptomyces sp. NBC_00237]
MTDASETVDSTDAIAVVEPFVPQRAVPGDLAAWCSVFSEGNRESSGSSASPAVLAELLLAEDPPAMRWAVRSGRGGGAMRAVAELKPQPHQEDTAFLRLFVAPSARRRGLGSALLAHAMRGAAGAGTARVQATVLGGPPGEPFARTVPGMRVLLPLELQEQPLAEDRVVRRCRELAECPPPGVRARGYRVVHWLGVAPEPLVASFGRVMGHVMDAPGAAMQLAARTWDAAAVREWEARMTEGGDRLMVCAAVGPATGVVVAVTVATVPPGGGPAADQHDTAVAPGHRGHGLARWVKAAQAVRMSECFPGVLTVTSTVHRENLSMAAVNRALGYRSVRTRLLVEAPVVC